MESYRITSAFTPIIHFYRSPNLFNLSVTIDYDVFTVDFQKSVLIGNSFDLFVFVFFKFVRIN